MYAVEFETKIIDGTVRIPAECQNLLSEYVKVIILMKDQDGEIRPRQKSKLTSDPIKVEKIILPSREEIYVR